MQVELTYQVPYRRLAKLSWSMSLKAFRTSWLLFGLLLAGYVAALAGIIIYADALDRWMLSVGIPPALRGALPIASVVAIFLAGCIVVRRLQRKQAKSRVDFDHSIRLTNDDGGLRIASGTIEYYLKWQGISQMLVERDGIVVSHGNLFFLVPDAAFPDAGTRLAFIRDVYGHLSDKARSISEKHIRPVLDHNL
jgi:hypothetical protein